MSREERMRQILGEALSPLRLEIHNDSHLHAGHAGDDGSGESHFRIIVVSPLFRGKTRVERHRMVFEAIPKEIQSIHALSIQALSPEEINQV